jgi:Ca2+-binding RTX toxin-like protein
VDSYAYLREVGVDKVSGGPGDDTVVGDSRGRFGNRLLGGAGADEITGGRKDDDLRGGSGDDSLFGERGNDKLNGGPDTDECEQGPGTGPVRNCEVTPAP